MEGSSSSYAESFAPLLLKCFDPPSPLKSLLMFLCTGPIPPTSLAALKLLTPAQFCWQHNKLSIGSFKT